MKKIIIFSSGVNLYGAQRGLLNLVRALSGCAHITVVMPDYGPLREHLERIDKNIVVKVFPLPIVVASWSPYYYIRFFLLSIVSFFYFLFYIKHNNFDVVITNNILLLAPAIVARLIGVPHVWCVREFFHYKKVNAFLGTYIQKTSQFIIAQSKSIQDELGIKNNCSIVYEPLVEENYTIYDTELMRQELRIKPHAIVVSLISRIHPLKGQYEFLKACKGILAEYDDVCMLIVGDVSALSLKNYIYKYKITRFVKRHGQGRIKLLGFVEEVDKILSASDMCVFPFKRKEPFGIAVQEALSFGKTCFYPKEAGLAEIFDIYGRGRAYSFSAVKKEIIKVRSSKQKASCALTIPEPFSFVTYQKKIQDILLQKR